MGTHTPLHWVSKREMPVLRSTRTLGSKFGEHDARQVGTGFSEVALCKTLPKENGTAVDLNPAKSL